MLQTTVFAKLLFGLLCIQGAVSDGEVWRKERELYDKLLTDYHKILRPRRNPSEVVSVSFGKSLLEIEELNMVTQSLTVHGHLKIFWKDEFLSWNTSEYEGIRDMRLPMKMLWGPDIHLINSRDLGMWESADDILAMVYPDGTVFWILPVMAKVGCKMDLTYFPYDKHHCALSFGSWAYDASQVNITLMGGTELELDKYSEHHEWELEEVITTRNETMYKCCPEPYIDITFSLTLARKGNNYGHMVVGPSVVLMFLMPAVFILPPDSAEKINLGVGVMICQTLMLVAVENVLPSGHPTVPAIVILFLVNLVLTALSLFVATIIVRTWSKSNRNSTMPWLIRTLVLGVLGRLLCVQRETFMPVEGTRQAPGVDMRRLDIEGSSGSEPVPSFADDDKQQLMQTYARLTTVSEWRQLAVILDRLFFLVFIVTATITLFAKH